MGKFEGMDPKLVRDLLSEVQQAAVRMRSDEERVNHLMRGAGLPAPSTHRPAQIADDCEKMIRDVSNRVELLEKKVKQEGTAPPAEPRAGGVGSDSRKAETDSPGGDARPRVGDQSADTAPRDNPKDQPASDTPKGDDAKSKTDSKGDETSPRDGSKDSPRAEDAKPETGSKDSPRAEDAKPETGSKDSPRAEDAKPETGSKDSPQAGDPKPETGSKGDEISPREGEEPKDVVKPEPLDPDPVPEPRPEAEDAQPQAPRDEYVDSVVPGPGESSRDGEQPVDPAPRETPNPDPVPEEPRADDARPQAPRVEDLKPAVPGPGENVQGGAGPGPGENVQGGVAPGPGENVQGGEIPGPGENVQGGAVPGPGEGAQGGEQPVDPAPRETPNPDPVPEEPRADDSRTQVDQINDTSPRTGETTPDAPANDPDGKGDVGSKGDERSPREEGGTSGTDIVDTPQKDHPDDIDQSGDSQPKVVEIDGVKVLQIPLDSPTAEQVSELLKNIEDIPPLGMPEVDGVSDVSGQPGWVEPNEPLSSAKPDFPLLDTAEPAPGQTVQPPDTDGKAATPPAGTAQGGAPAQSIGTALSVDAGTQSVGTTTSGDAGTQPIGTGVSGDAGTQAAGTATGNAPGQTVGTGDEGAVARWADDGSDVVSAEAGPLDMDALKTLVDNVSEIEPLDMPGVQVPDGETWGEGAWAPMDIRPDGPADDVDPGDPLRSIPPLGGGK
ncbi:hypothetical protein J2853_005405 [Streptosporangium lutulentum]|uniref:Uncharacterized protein n=2 Tax=Streptosporangium lutulentum TaxID=1461250 RepID=A0ABT9QHM6_9ACTN|nr:hypothetical protein [Streptosporangium lutulentum]MDP9846194.1 hypothetical protein [Streptosporangium lutulentum]